MVVSIKGEEYYTAEEACGVLGVKLGTLYSYVHRGLLPSYRQMIRRQRLYRRQDVDSLLEVRPAERDVSAQIPPAHTWTGEH